MIRGAMDLKLVDKANPALRAKARDLSAEELATGTVCGLDAAELVERMTALMVHSDGIGLAAPQVGLPVNLAVFRLDGGGGDLMVTVCYANIRVTDRSRGVFIGTEGCLSLPGVSVPVPRWHAVTFQGLEFMPRRADCWRQRPPLHWIGYAARLVQHEFDHLHGRLITDYEKGVPICPVCGKFWTRADGCGCPKR